MADTPVRPLRQLAADLSVDVQRLGAQLGALAAAESRVAVRTAATSLAGIAGGALVALVGIQVLAAALVLGLVALGLPPWAAALIGAVLLIGGGGAVAWVYVGRLRAAPFGLPETRAGLAETMAWLKAETQR
jgi:hypothetical protein